MRRLHPNSFGQAFFNDVLGKRGQRNAAAATDKTRRDLAKAEESPLAALLRGYTGGGPADRSRVELIAMLCGEDDDDDDMFDGSSSTGVAGCGCGGDKSAPPPPPHAFSVGFDLFGGGFHDVTNGILDGDHHQSAFDGGGEYDASGAACDKADGGYDDGGYDDGGGGDGEEWSVQEQVEQRSAFVICGEQAIQPPAHGSTNMQRAMDAATPEYERLQRAVDG